MTDAPCQATTIMRFRPCIDLHDGKVKQIVGASLKDAVCEDNSSSSSSSSSSSAVENFVSAEPSAYYAELYKRDALPGGHVIMLGLGNEEAAISALRAYPGGMQVGGGVKPETARKYIEAGASHVIVTSYVFKDGKVSFENLQRMVDAVGKDRLVLDLSCRKRPREKNGKEKAEVEVTAAAAADTSNGPPRRGGDDDNDDEKNDDAFYVVTDRWQKYTDVAVNAQSLSMLAAHCDEFLVHGVDVEGKRQGVLEDLVELLAEHSPIPVTYAGGVRDMADMERVRNIGRGRVDLTIGSALDIFGGEIPYADVVRWQRDQEAATKRKKKATETLGGGNGGAIAEKAASLAKAPKTTGE